MRLTFVANGGYDGTHRDIKHDRGFIQCNALTYENNKSAAPFVVVIFINN